MPRLLLVLALIFAATDLAAGLQLAPAPPPSAPPAAPAPSATRATPPPATSGPATISGSPLNLARGKIAYTSGPVEIQQAGSSAWAVAAVEDYVLAGARVRTGAAGRAVLGLSTGALVLVEPDSELALADIRQAPYHQNSLGTFLRLKADPSKSWVLLDVPRGVIAVEVKPLNVGEGSMFTVDTPLGVVSVRGGAPVTLFRVGVGAPPSPPAGMSVKVGAYAGDVQVTLSASGFAPRLVVAGRELEVSAFSAAPTGMSAVSGVETDFTDPVKFAAGFAAGLNHALRAHNQASPGAPIPPYVPPPPPPSSPTAGPVVLPPPTPLGPAIGPTLIR